MTSAVASVEVEVPAERAWAALTDWRRQSAWMPMTTVEVREERHGLGTVLAARTGVGPLAVLDPMGIDVWQPPTRCEVEHLGRVLRARGIFTVQPLGAARCRVSWEEQLDGAAARLGAPLGRLMLAVALRRFARQLTADAGG